MNPYVEILKISLSLIVMGLLALPFLGRESAGFYIDVIGLSINALVSILCFFKIRKLSGR